VLTPRRRRDRERGQILVMFAFSMLFLIVGMIVVAIDLSELYEARVRLQDAAEQAAMAGAGQVDYVSAESGTPALLASFAATCSSAGDAFSRVAVAIPIPCVGGTFTVTASFTAAPVLGGQAPVG